LGALPTQATSLTLGEPAPDTELFAVGKRIFKALHTHFASPAHFFGLTGGCTTLGKEQIGIDTQAVCLILPCAVVTFRDIDSLTHYPLLPTPPK